jgi:hypothetical protein
LTAVTALQEEQEKIAAWLNDEKKLTYLSKEKAGKATISSASIWNALTAPSWTSSSEPPPAKKFHDSAEVSWEGLDSWLE